ncbi:MAG TPA: MraY family glycosyltransferase [Chitinophagales bacterium]|nr:MraY family glycosyltransferase [Chitinophagales bacterium]
MGETDSALLLPIAYSVFFVIAIFFSFLINGLLLKFSRTLGNRQMQHRHNIRWSNNVKPSVGGFSFYIVFLISISIFSIFNFSEQEYLNKHLLGIVAAVTTAFLLGLADDAYDTIPLLKFFSQLCCGLFLVVTGTIIPATGIYVCDVLITLIWVVGIMNSINMLDNMDSISAIVSLCLMLSCFLVLLLEKNIFSFYSVMLIGVSGAVGGFLYFNWHPARIYMGDTGSQFLGAFISAISIPILWKYHTPSGGTIQLTQYLIPLMAFTVPIIDTATVFMRRIARGHSPFIGGKDHISHHFVYAGLKDKQVIYLLGGCSFISALLTVYLISVRTEMNPMLMTICYSYFIFLFIVVQYFYDRGMKKERARLKAEPEKQTMKTEPKTKSVTA